MAATSFPIVRGAFLCVSSDGKPVHIRIGAIEMLRDGEPQCLVAVAGFTFPVDQPFAAVWAAVDGAQS